MQTFLPYADFQQSARCLDDKRLGKQRVEVKQIYRALTGETKGWRNHPATLMWKNHEWQLLTYGMVICTEWINRGHEDSLLKEFMRERSSGELKMTMPWWLGDPDFHNSHRSNLYRKDPIMYNQWAALGADRPYLWPQENQTFKVGTLPKLVSA